MTDPNDLISRLGIKEVASDAGTGDEEQEISDIRRPVRAVVDRAVELAGNRASSDQVVQAMTKGLAYLSNLFEEQVGSSAQKTFEEFVRTYHGPSSAGSDMDGMDDLDLFGAGMMAPSSDLAEDGGHKLPQVGSGSPLAELLLGDAVQTSVMLNAYGPGNEAILEAARALHDHISVMIGGRPSWPELHSAMTVQPSVLMDAGWSSVQRPQ